MGLKELLAYIYPTCKNIRDVNISLHEIKFKYDEDILGDGNYTPEYAYVSEYELMHRCKDWGIHNNYQMSSYPDFGTMDWFCQVTTIDKTGVNRKTFSNSSESSAVFKAFKWIIEK